ncbi:baseplate assembly protein [Wohlfahrtiimonas larvae]|uniref:Baseplate assembly protein n=1 Tax=Wohlfahrtiimonas larvae TaxID=1157986 RepID=A0ABP9MIV7_9GAMM
MVNLNGLPEPTFFYDINYENELKNLQDEFLKLNPSYEDLLLESDPINKTLQVFAYKAVLLKSEVNEKLKQCLLKYATAENLDQVAANSVTQRLPNESDESLRYRASIAPEGFTCAGPSGAYEYHALNVSSDVMHATVLAHTPIQGYVTVVLLSHSNFGEASEELRDQVWNHLSAEEVRPLCDTVHVEKAIFKDTEIIIKATYFEGSDKDEVNARILKSLEYLSELNATERKAKDIFKPKEMLTVNQIHQAARVAGVQNIEVISPKTDIQTGAKESIRIIKREIKDGGWYE